MEKGGKVMPANRCQEADMPLTPQFACQHKTELCPSPSHHTSFQSHGPIQLSLYGKGRECAEPRVKVDGPEG